MYLITLLDYNIISEKQCYTDNIFFSVSSVSTHSIDDLVIFRPVHIQCNEWSSVYLPEVRRVKWHAPFPHTKKQKKKRRRNLQPTEETPQAAQPTAQITPAQTQVAQTAQVTPPPPVQMTQDFQQTTSPPHSGLAGGHY